MNATTIKTEIEKLSGYSFQDFQDRARSLAFDCALVMQEVKQKYGRLITGAFLKSELGFTPRFVDSYKAVSRSKIGSYDSGIRIRYALENNEKHKGLRWLPNAKKWSARITINGKQKYLGCFSDKADAIEAYEEAKANLK